MVQLHSSPPRASFLLLRADLLLHQELLRVQGGPVGVVLALVEARVAFDRVPARRGVGFTAFTDLAVEGLGGPVVSEFRIPWRARSIRIPDTLASPRYRNSVLFL